MRGPGRRLGVDVGSVRVGVALSDPAGILASPLVTLARDVRNRRDLAQLGELVLEYDVVEVIVGLPRHLSGQLGTSARDADDYAQRLGHRIAPVPVRLVDERLSTVSASRSLRDRGSEARISARSSIRRPRCTYSRDGSMGVRGTVTDEDGGDLSSWSTPTAQRVPGPGTGGARGAPWVRPSPSS